MAYTSEIEKLERRFAENPAGRNFAPLADAYRKAGELDRAIELCKSGLERHPDYISAHIVYGRCLMDQKNDAAAVAVFQKIIALDPENIIGLKVLAEIAERTGRFEEAVQWLTRLLAADPMNGDAAEALARARGKAAQAVKTTEPMAMAAQPEAPEPAPEPMPSTAETTAGADVPTAPPQPEDAIEMYDGTLGFDDVVPEALKTEGLELQEDGEIRPQELAVEGLHRTQYESGQFFAPAEPPPAEPKLDELEEELPSVDLPLIMPEDVTPRALGARKTLPPPAPPPPAAVMLSDDDGAADTAALSQAEPVLTETMAELYLKQGHTEDALRVYQALLAQRPGDLRLRAKVDALRGTGSGDEGRGTGGVVLSGQSIRAFLKSILVARPGAAVPLPATTLDSAFAGTPADAEREAPGAPARPTDEGISLDAVFGDEGGGGHEPPAPVGNAPPAGPGTGAGFSFDDFFGGPAAAPTSGSGTSPAPPSKTPGGPPARPSRRAAEEEEGDLDQFQAWLKGLKS